MSWITLRAAESTDAGAIARVHAASWRDAYADVLDADYLADEVDADRLAAWTERFSMRNPDQLIQVAAAANGQIIGFVCAYLNLDPFGAR